MLEKLELTVHEHIMLCNEHNDLCYLEVWLIRWSSDLSSHLFFRKETPNKYSLNMLMQYITNVKFASFCWKNLYMTFVYRSCMFVKPICCSTIPFVPSQQQTCVAGKRWRSHYSSWYSNGFTESFLQALTWPHTKWIMMQLILQSNWHTFM